MTLHTAMTGDLATATDDQIQEWWDELNRELIWPNLAEGWKSSWERSVRLRILQVRDEGARRFKASRRTDQWVQLPLPT